MDEHIRDASWSTPDPDRAAKNLDRLSRGAPEFFAAYAEAMRPVAALFAYSQFLADYSVKNPPALERALADIERPVTKEEILAGTASPWFTDKGSAIKALRDIKKRYLLRITLRDVTGLTGIEEAMAELSELADALVTLALDAARSFVRERYGDLADNPFTVIALGKLGAGELNYSSDIDIVTVYGRDEGVSTGVVSHSGLLINKVGAHEYFCKLTETLSGLLMQQTEDGFAYRVDLRLRPDGRKGQLSLPLAAYASYYESWGTTWERMALIRARPVAGDGGLGYNFLETIEPFVWKRTTDYYDIEEIRELKRKIDTVFDANDIKRGYGGIREIEFFVQTFQLLYGGERAGLRTARLAEVLAELLREEFLTADDVHTLTGGYRFLRRVEHVLQMRDDVQTHTLPVRAEELEVFARKLKFEGERAFSSELRLWRLKVRDMYNSLLGGPESQPESAIFLEEVLTDDEIRDYLAYKAFADPELALNNIKSLKEQIRLGKTTRERTLLRKVIPMFLERILKVANKDRALSMFVTLIARIGVHESYIELFSQRPDIVELIVGTFSRSTYLSRSLLSLENLESLFEYPDIRLDYKSVKERLVQMLTYSREPANTVREFKAIEEMRAGMLFLEKVLDIDGFSKKLTMLADTVVRSAAKHLKIREDLAVVALGRFGAGELVIGSDLDLIFVSTTGNQSRGAEELIKFLSEYTARGVAYSVDMRLRPDGSKGILVNDIDGYLNYYLKSAQPWELQALLRARVITGRKESLRAFSDLKKHVIGERGREIDGAAVRNVRARIISELSKEREGYDIKLGPGGIEEILFIVQYLQLKNAASYPDLIVAGTANAMRRLAAHGLLDPATAATLSRAYVFMRTVEATLRLNEENVLKRESPLSDAVAAFLGFSSCDLLIEEVEAVRKSVMAIASSIYR